MTLFFVFSVQCIIKQLLDLDFVIFRIIQVSLRVISLSLWLITLTSTSIILDITKTSIILDITDFCFSSRNPVFFRGTLNARPGRLKILAFCPEHPKRDQNPKFTPLSEKTNTPVCLYGSPPGVVGCPVRCSLDELFHRQAK